MAHVVLNSKLKLSFHLIVQWPPISIIGVNVVIWILLSLLLTSGADFFVWVFPLLRLCFGSKLFQ